MSIIEKIRRRVEKADQQLGAGAARNRDYAQRLTKLLDRLEIEHEGRKVRTERLHLENDELRAMLLVPAVRHRGGGRSGCRSPKHGDAHDRPGRRRFRRPPRAG